MDTQQIDPQKLLRALDTAKANPNSSFATELRKRIQNKSFDNELAQLGIQNTEMGLKKIGEPGQFQTQVDIGKNIAISQGKPVALSDDRVEPTVAGQIVRAPLKLAGRLAANVRAAGDFAAGKDYMEATNPIYTKLTGDVTPIGVAGEREINQMKAQGITPTAGDQLRTGAKDFVDFLGAGAESASYAVGGEAAGSAAKAASLSVKEIVKQGVKTAGKSALAGGLGSGGAEAQNPNATVGSILAQTALGTAIGGAGGFGASTVPGLSKAGVKGVTNKITGGANYLRGAKLTPAFNTATRQRVGQELVRQGVDENVVKVVANASDVNVKDFQQMYAHAKTAMSDPTSTARATDVTGKTFLDRLRHIDTVNKKAGSKLDEVASALAGNKSDHTPVTQFMDSEMQKIGATKGFADNGAPVLDFTGSDFEGMKPIENTINSVYTRLNDPNIDDLGMHRLKRFIDNQVSYAKETGGLTGQAERILKGLRSTIDSTLDNNHAEYKAVNDIYGSSKQLLDNTNKLLGNTRPLTEELKDAKAGDVMRRLLGNSANRNNIANIVAETQKYAVGTGYDDGKDLVQQVVFADMLEGMFGTQATTGLQGQVQRAVTAGQDLASGNIFSSVGKTAGNVIKKGTRINEQRKDAALRALLGLNPKIEKAVATTEEKIGKGIATGAGAYVVGKQVTKNK